MTLVLAVNSSSKVVPVEVDGERSGGNKVSFITGGSLQSSSSSLLITHCVTKAAMDAMNTGPFTILSINACMKVSNSEKRLKIWLRVSSHDFTVDHLCDHALHKRKGGIFPFSRWRHSTMRGKRHRQSLWSDSWTRFSSSFAEWSERQIFLLFALETSAPPYLPWWWERLSSWTCNRSDLRYYQHAYRHGQFHSMWISYHLGLMRLQLG